MWLIGPQLKVCKIARCWLSTAADQLPRINFGGEEMGGRDAVQVGWNALHHTFQSMGMLLCEDLSEWIQFPGVP